ncbi:unnamed protein product, partial [Polarella glacialis]
MLEQSVGHHFGGPTLVRWCVLAAYTLEFLLQLFVHGWKLLRAPPSHAAYPSLDEALPTVQMARGVAVAHICSGIGNLQGTELMVPTPLTMVDTTPMSSALAGPPRPTLLWCWFIERNSQLLPPQMGYPLPAAAVSQGHEASACQSPATKPSSNNNYNNSNNNSNNYN